MLHKIDRSNVLFLDIETVPETYEHHQLSEETQHLWEEKTRYQRQDESPEDFYRKAGIWAEFGKIICISVGYFVPGTRDTQFRIKSFTGQEADLLKEFKSLLQQHFNKKNQRLCAHNGKEFDFPYIARRMLKHQIELPDQLQLFDKKPWEIPHLDTLQLWRFGDYKHYTSLKLMAHVLNIPSPKDDIDGSQVSKIYYEDQNLERIVEYCEKDTLTVAQLFLRLRNEPLIETHQIHFSP